MDSILEQRRIECAAILDNLLVARAIPFDDNLESQLPAQQGLYAIARKSGPGECEYLRAGRTTGRRPGGLRERIWGDHFWGNAGGDLLQNVKGRHIKLGISQGTSNRQFTSNAQAWIQDNCVVQ